MDWLTIIVLAHLLMMPFCLKGMLKKRKELKKNRSEGSNSPNGVKDLHLQMEMLVEQNRQLQQEMKSLKKVNSKSELSSNVIQFNKENQKRQSELS